MRLMVRTLGSKAKNLNCILQDLTLYMDDVD